MSLDYLNEAFKKLSLLNEELFDTSIDGISKLGNFIDEDEEQEITPIIDPEADTVEELQPSYIGKVITNCNVCHSNIFKEKEDIIITEEGIVNPDDQCPYCGEIAGFTVVGEIVEYSPDGVEENTVDGTEVETPIVEEPEPTEDTLDESYDYSNLTIPAPYDQYMMFADADNSNSCGYGPGQTIEEYNATILGVVIAKPEYRDIIDGCYLLIKDPDGLAVVEFIDGPHGTRIYDLDLDSFDLAEGLGGAIVGGTLGGAVGGLGATIAGATAGSFIQDKLDETLTENTSNISVETDETVVTVHTDDDGSVDVSTEPKEDETSDETISPLSDETMNEIEQNNDVVDSSDSVDPVEDEVEIDIEEMDEESIDELGESYLTNVYENVESFKTTAVSNCDTHMIVEGIITFKSGSKKKTGFIFESVCATADGKVKFNGKNEQFSRGTKAFTLTGRVKDKKLISESLYYNYKAKNNDGSFRRIQGTVTTK